MILLALLLFGGIGLQLLNPQIVRTFLDTAQARGSSQVLVQSALFFLGVALTSQIVTTITGYVSEDVGWRATNQLRADLTAHCLNLDMTFHNAHTPGELIERVDGDVAILSEFFSNLVLQVVGNGVLAAGILLLLFREDPRIGLVGLGYGLILAVFLRLIQPRSVKALGEMRQADAELYSFFEESLVSTQDVRGVGAVAYVLRRFFGHMRNQFHLTRRARVILMYTFSAGFIIYVLTQALTLIIGGRLFLDGAITIGTLYLVVSYVDKLETPLNEIRRQVAQLHYTIASIGRIEEFLNQTPAVQENPTATATAGRSPVAFLGVSFGYGDRDDTLQDISFQLAPGQSLGLLGRTGSGKTTLTRLLFRLYDPDVGAIQLGGVDLRDLALSDLRRQVGMVTQEVQLFAASVRDNLTFFETTTSDAEILAALETLGLAEWAAALPQGLDTPLQAGGQGLSAGEAQLLAFARVFLKDPGLVILDEASSRLDPATERRLEHAVEKLLQGRTAIIIAHRLATLQQVDQILLLDQGAIAELGPREALAADPHSAFHRLLRIGQDWIADQLLESLGTKGV
jgi:ATP-binding cassette subfamily B protein